MGKSVLDVWKTNLVGSVCVYISTRGNRIETLALCLLNASVYKSLHLIGKEIKFYRSG